LKIIGEPVVMGLIIGAGIGILAGYNLQKVLDLAMKTGAVLLLMPRMIRLLMEGLTIIADGIREFLAKYMPDREIFIGLDAAVAVGHPSVITCSLIMIPVTIILAAILPGNKVLPFADLGIMPFFCLWPMIAAKKNLFRGLIIATINIVCILYITTWLAPVTTLMAEAVSFNIPENASEISSLDVGAHLVPFIIYKILAVFGG
jgi:PTS system galactitol-specific IIC component